MTNIRKEDVVNYINEKGIECTRKIIDKQLSIDKYNCFNIIYDIKELEIDALKILETLDIKELTLSNIVNMLYKTSYGVKYIIKNINYFLFNSCDSYIENIIVFFLNNYKKYSDVVKYLSKNGSLHSRFIFLKILITNYPNLIDEIYDDLVKYLRDDNELMNINEVCKLAYLCLKNNNDKFYNDIKNFIYSNYSYNNLAQLIFEDNPDDKIIRKLKNDIDRLFLTSSKYKLYIYQHYSKSVSEKVLNDFHDKIKYFEKKSEHKYSYNLEKIYIQGLGNTLEEYIEKYFSISKSKDYGFIASGSTTETYKIGDYAFKLSKQKWSNEKIICPDLFLIAKNYEEDFVKDENDKVIAAIEIQKYLENETKNIPKKYFRLYERELSKYGYYVDDTLVGGYYGDNTRLLDSYLDAYNAEKEDIPQWFKEYPIVLVDRDRVYKKDKGTNYFERRF